MIVIYIIYFQEYDLSYKVRNIQNGRRKNLILTTKQIKPGIELLIVLEITPFLNIKRTLSDQVRVPGIFKLLPNCSFYLFFKALKIQEDMNFLTDLYCPQIYLEHIIVVMGVYFILWKLMWTYQWLVIMRMKSFSMLCLLWI